MVDRKFYTDMLRGDKSIKKSEQYSVIVHTEH